MKREAKSVWSGLSFEEQLAHYERWKEKGLSQAWFCKQQGISLEEFHVWRNGLDVKRSNFCEIKCKDDLRETPLLRVEFNFRNQITARIEANAQQFGALLREVLDATAVIR